MTRKPDFERDHLPDYMEDHYHVNESQHTASAIDATDNLWRITGHAAHEFAFLEEILSNPDLNDDERAKLIADAADRADLNAEVIEEKMASCAAWRRKLESDVDVIECEAKRIKDLLDAASMRAENFDKYLIQCLSRLGGKWQSPTAKLAISTSKSLEIVDESKIPSRLADPKNAKFWRKPKPCPWEPDKKALKVALEAGELSADEHGVKIKETKHVRAK